MLRIKLSLLARTFGIGLVLATSVSAQQPPTTDQPASLATSDPNAPVCSEPQCPIAIRGAATVTVADLGAKLATLEEKQRNVLLADPRALNGVIENLLITRQIALEANRARIDKDPFAQARLAQVADEVYAVMRLDEIRAERIGGDYEKLAREHYITNKVAFTKPREQVVRHILIDTTARTEAEAFAEATRLHATLAKASKDEFSAKTVEVSDDPSKRQNGGMFTVAEGDPKFDPAFVIGAMNLKTPGEVSPPIKSAYGYHLIQLLSSNPAETMSFEDAKPMIIERVRQDARRRVVSEYRSDLTAASELKLFPENAREMILEPETALKQGR